MEAGIFFLAWVFLGFAVLAFALMRSSEEDEVEAEREAKSPFGKFARVVLAVLAIGAFAVIPVAVVSAADDRVPSGAGTFTDASTEQLREGRLLFRETCASCHTLEAVNARGVYGPNLDTLGGLNKERVVTAIETGAGTGSLMPPGLVQGEQADLVAEYVEAVAGAGRN